MSVTNTLATRSGPGQVTGPADALIGPAGPQIPQAGGPGGGRHGPPFSRPILPQERGYLDKFVEFRVSQS